MTNEYFSWLLGMIDDHIADRYILILSYLGSREFYEFVPNDDNRSSDGLALRERFYDMTGSWPREGPCTILEMLIAFSERFAFELDEDYPYMAVRCFWHFLDNLGLWGCTDESRDWDLVDVARIVERFMDRKYTSKGKGSLFPCPKTKKDLREVELWYQMHEYISWVGRDFVPNVPKL